MRYIHKTLDNFFQFHISIKNISLNFQKKEQKTIKLNTNKKRDKILLFN